MNFSAKQLRTACFTGHRNMRLPYNIIERRVVDEVEGLIGAGYRYFGAGGARGFDALASEVVLALKKKHPDIHLILVLPFDNQYEHERGWSQAEIEQYHDLKDRASKVTIIAPEYRSGIYYQRNRHLVDYSSACIAYMTHDRSGTGYTVNCAKRKGLRIINVAD